MRGPGVNAERAKNEGLVLAPPPAPWRSTIPGPDPENALYFDALVRHELLILRCRADGCRRWVHYPLASCPTCHGFDLAPEAVSGRGEIYSYTLVNREFTPNYPPPYVAVLVDLDEQPGLRILSNIVGCAVSDVAIGLRVRATFADYETHSLVYFEPDLP
jgi:uncharacterized OB-fold protein